MTEKPYSYRFEEDGVVKEITYEIEQCADHHVIKKIPGCARIIK